MDITPMNFQYVRKHGDDNATAYNKNLNKGDDND